MGCCAALICSNIFDCPCGCCDCTCCNKWWCNCCICSKCCREKGKGYIGVSDVDEDNDNDNDNNNSKIITVNPNKAKPEKVVEIKVKSKNEDEKANLLQDYENGDEQKKIIQRGDQSGLGPFIHQYLFLYTKQTVILQNYFGTTLSNNTERNKGTLSNKGGYDENAEWNVQFDGKDKDLVVVKFRNTATGKYLRIIENGDVVDCKGDKKNDKFSRFKVHQTDDNYFKFESCEFDEKYLGVTYDKVVGDNKGNDEKSLFSVWSNNKDEPAEIARGDQSGSDEFINNYKFNNNGQTIILKGYFGKSLKISTNEKNKSTELDTINGSSQTEAQFIVEFESNQTDIIKFKSNKTKKYIRIIDNKINCGGTGGKYTKFKLKQVKDKDSAFYTFESCVYPSNYIAVTSDDNVCIGSGDKFSQFTLWSNQSDDNVNDDDDDDDDKIKFQIPYTLSKDKTECILKHSLGKTLRVAPNNEDNLNDKGGKGKFARWIIEFDGEQDGKTVVKIKSRKSNKYINILDDGNIVNCKDLEGNNKFSRFKVHKCGASDNNKYKFESCQFKEKYISTQENGGIIVSSGDNKYAEFELFCNVKQVQQVQQEKEEKEDEKEDSDDDGSDDDEEKSWFDNIEEISSFIKKQKKKNKDKELELTQKFWRSLNKKKARKLDRILMEIQEFIGVTNFDLRMTLWERVDKSRKKLKTMSGLQRLLYQLVIEYINQKDKKRKKPEEKKVKQFMIYLSENIISLDTFPPKQKDEMNKEEFARSIDNWMTAIIEKYKE